MEILDDRFDEVAAPRSGESEIEYPGTSFDRIKVRIAGNLRQAAETLYGKTEDNQTPRGAPNFGSQAGAWLHNSVDYIERMEPKKSKMTSPNKCGAIRARAFLWPALSG